MQCSGRAACASGQVAIVGHQVMHHLAFEASRRPVLVLVDLRTRPPGSERDAGVAAHGSLEEVTPEEMLQCYTVNTIGPILVVQQLLKHKLLPSGALIVNISSLVRFQSLNASVDVLRCTHRTAYVAQHAVGYRRVPQRAHAAFASASIRPSSCRACMLYSRECGGFIALICAPAMCTRYRNGRS
jgi:hypothetical protein